MSVRARVWASPSFEGAGDALSCEVLNKLEPLTGTFDSLVK